MPANRALLLKQIQNSNTNDAIGEANSLGLSRLELAKSGSHPTVPSNPPLIAFLRPAASARCVRIVASVDPAQDSDELRHAGVVFVEGRRDLGGFLGSFVPAPGPTAKPREYFHRATPNFSAMAQAGSNLIKIV